MRGDIIYDEATRPNYIYNLLDADMAFCTNMRNNDVYLYVTNRLDWGHLVTVDNFETTHLNNEMYEIQNNRWDWEKRYLHVNYSQNLDVNVTVASVTEIISVTILPIYRLLEEKTNLEVPGLST